MIVRVFRARVQPGRAEEFREFFRSKALPLVRGQDGLVSAEVGWPLEPDADEFLMITVWRDVDALRRFAGEDWQEARILPEEQPLLRETFVHHYEAASL